MKTLKENMVYYFIDNAITNQSILTDGKNITAEKISSLWNVPSETANDIMKSINNNGKINFCLKDIFIYPLSLNIGTDTVDFTTDKPCVIFRKTFPILVQNNQWVYNIYEKDFYEVIKERFERCKIADVVYTDTYNEYRFNYGEDTTNLKPKSLDEIIEGLKSQEGQWNYMSLINPNTMNRYEFYRVDNVL